MRTQVLLHSVSVLVLLGWAGLSGASEPAMALDMGERAPDVTLPDQFGQDVPMSSLWADGPVVVFFYPKDFTPNCTKEAISFRDARNELEDLGLKVVGISIDTVGSHLRFDEAYDLGFPVLSDVHARAAEAFRVRDTLQGFVLARRVTFLIDEGGEIAWIWDPADPIEHATAVIAEARRLEVVPSGD